MIEVKLDSAKLGKIIILINYGKTLKNCHTISRGRRELRVRVRSRRLRGSRQLEQQAACSMQQAAVIKSCNKKLLGVHSGSPRLLLVLMACNFSLAPDSRVRGQVRLLQLLLLGLAWLLTANGKWCGKDEAAGEVAVGLGLGTWWNRAHLN